MTHHPHLVQSPPASSPTGAAFDGRPDWLRLDEILGRLEHHPDRALVAEEAAELVENFLRQLGYGAVAQTWRAVRNAPP